MDFRLLHELAKEYEVAAWMGAAVAAFAAWLTYEIYMRSKRDKLEETYQEFDKKLAVINHFLDQAADPAGKKDSAEGPGTHAIDTKGIRDLLALPVTAWPSPAVHDRAYYFCVLR